MDVSSMPSITHFTASFHTTYFPRRILTSLARYTVKTSPPIEEGPVTSCNCSICHVNGYLMVYPLETNITWHSGKDNMTSDTFGQERVAHTFCTVCGTSIGGKSTDPNSFADHRAVNVRTLKDVDVEALKLRKVDGRSR